MIGELQPESDAAPVCAESSRAAHEEPDLAAACFPACPCCNCVCLFSICCFQSAGLRTRACMLIMLLIMTAGKQTERAEERRAGKEE